MTGSESDSSTTSSSADSSETGAWGSFFSLTGDGYPDSNGGCSGSYSDGAVNVSVPLIMAAILASKSTRSYQNKVVHWH